MIHGVYKPTNITGGAYCSWRNIRHISSGRVGHRANMRKWQVHLWSQEKIDPCLQFGGSTPKKTWWNRQLHYLWLWPLYDSATWNRFMLGWFPYVPLIQPSFMSWRRNMGSLPSDNLAVCFGGQGLDLDGLLFPWWFSIANYYPPGKNYICRKATICRSFS
jgi:hypothetical protein